MKILLIAKLIDTIMTAILHEHFTTSFMEIKLGNK